MKCVDDFETSCVAAKVSSPSTSHVFFPVEVPSHSNRRSRSCRKMAQSRVFTLLGDSNVRRYINKTSVRASQDIKSAQILSCSRLEIFKEVPKSFSQRRRRQVIPICSGYFRIKNSCRMTFNLELYFDRTKFFAFNWTEL